MPHHKGHLKEYCHVIFASDEDAEKALQLNGQRFLGRVVEIRRPGEGGASAQHTRYGGSVGKPSGATRLKVSVRGFDRSLREDPVISCLFSLTLCLAISCQRPFLFFSHCKF